VRSASQVFHSDQTDLKAEERVAKELTVSAKDLGEEVQKVAQQVN